MLEHELPVLSGRGVVVSEQGESQSAKDSGIFLHPSGQYHQEKKSPKEGDEIFIKTTENIAGKTEFSNVDFIHILP